MLSPDIYTLEVDVMIVLYSVCKYIDGVLAPHRVSEHTSREEAERAAANVEGGFVQARSV